MIGVAAFNILMIGLAVGIWAGPVPVRRVAMLLDWLHSIIGITAPGLEKARLVALIWIASMIVIVDGLVALLVFLTWRLM